MILLSHPTANADVRQTALALAEADLLSEFWTCINWNPDALIARLLPMQISRQFSRRSFTPSLRPFIHAYPWREAARLFAPSVGLEFVTRHEVGAFSIDAVFRSLDSKVAKRLTQLPDIRAVYAKEDGARDTFLSARKQNIKCLYELPIGYWRAGHRIYNEEKERMPEWADTLTGMRDSAAKLSRKDEELQLADVVFVASSFTQATLKEAPNFSAPTYIIPFGGPLPLKDISLERTNPSRLKVLFVGSLTQRKGLSYLLEAVKVLGRRVELTLIGKKTDSVCLPLEAALREHRWLESVPHSEILREMQQHDVLVFPSLFEGFGLVIPEAMSQGLPVITTLHTAGPDIITDGEDGFLVPIRDSEAIINKLSLLIDDPQLLNHMKIAALNKATFLTWQRYREAIVKIIQSELFLKY